MIPFQAVCNKLGIELLPEDFRTIKTLERTLVSKRIFFKKVVILPKGQAPKIKGTICNVPVKDAETYCSTLPRPAYSNGLLIVKLKKTLEYMFYDMTLESCFL